MRFCLALFFLICGCSDAQTTSGKDMAGGTSICPNHPSNCAGACCGSVCTFTQVDINNCGTCGNACPMGSVCSSGSCGCPPTGAACASGSTCCGSDGCADLQTDPKHCGSCTNKCGEGFMCLRGSCVCGNAGVGCPVGNACCNGTCMSTCPVAPPDMATADAGPALPDCDCTGLTVGCVLSMLCVAKDCCFEDTQGIPILKMCTATPTLCKPSGNY